MVRARVREDLVRLVAEHQRFGVGDKPEILDLPGHDYPYRIVIPKAEWVALASRLAEMIDYSNFKSAVEEKALDGFSGQARHDLYMKVWGVMHGAEGWLRKRVRDLRRPRPEQGGLGFWESPGRYRSDPRSDTDMQAFYQPTRGWEEWLEEDEDRAVVCDLPIENEVAMNLESTGYDQGELFRSEAEVRGYFSATNFAAMFPGEPVPDQADLDEMTETVLSRKLHCDF